MKHLTLSFAICAALAAPVTAQEVDEGFNLMEEGARLILRGLMQEMEPTIEELEGLADELRPAFREFAGDLRPLVSDMLRIMDDVQYYHGPEILDNGDVIFRRRDDAPPFEPEDEHVFPGEMSETDNPQIEL